MAVKAPERPYLTVGEIYRSIAVALGTKNRNSEVDRMARQGDYDYQLRDKLLTDLFYKPLEKQAGESFAKFACNAIDHFVSEYIGLVKAVPLDAMKREESLPALFKFFISRQVAGIVTQFYKKFGGPSPEQYFCSDNNQKLGVTCQWLEDNNESFSILLKSINNKQHQDQYRKWKQGKELPKAGSFPVFLEKLPSSDKLAVSIQLIAGRMLQYYVNSYSQFDISTCIEEVLWEAECFDVGEALSLANSDCSEKFNPLKLAVMPVFVALDRKSEKNQSSKDESWALLEKFEHEINELDPDGITRHVLEWQKARWYVFSGDYKTALKQYEIAFEYSLYRAMNTPEILQEALALAAKERDRALLKRLKNQAIAFGYYEIPSFSDNLSQANKKSKSHVVEDWEVEQWDTAFAFLFKPECCFPSCIVEEKHVRNLPFVHHVKEKHFKRKPNLTNPDQRIDVGISFGGIKRRYPQLIWHTDCNHPHHVKTLLEAGAKVDQLSDTSDSALLMSIIEVVNTGDRRCFDLIKQYTHCSVTMNMRTDKKKRTILLQAVETGEPDIVETVVAMGADVDRRGHTDSSTALNQCIKYIGSIKNPRQALANMQHFNPNDPVLIDTIRRNVSGMMGLTDEQVRKNLIRSVNDEKAQVYRLAVAEYYWQKLQSRFDYRKLCQIAEFLLEHGASPNAVHTSPIDGYTPLMLAVEIDEPELVKLMLEKGGNPYKTYKHDGRILVDCWMIAAEFGSNKVLSVLGSV
ncbi:ankyrin repeat domain-containing protein [Endozoicomonadaceae bacterium StTr2]